MTEFDAWQKRNNNAALKNDDAVLQLLQFRPGRLLEIGCGFGRRFPGYEMLGWSKENLFGMDISPLAINMLQERGYTGWVGDISETMLDRYSVIICGFFFYQLPRERLFSAAANINSMLKVGGELIIHDFWDYQQFARINKHNDKMLAYHGQPDRLFTGSGIYQEVSCTKIIDEARAVKLVKLEERVAWPVV